MTYSLLAQDPGTGEIGVAAQSHFFGVGRLVGWLEAGVGGVATQALVNVDFGPNGLESMRGGEHPTDILKTLVAQDDYADFRQFALINATGEIAVHTGNSCVQAATSRIGENVVAQGNMLASPTVCEAMVSTYEHTQGSMADRMLAALQSAEAEGGDARGSQSAVLKVVSGTRSDTPWRESRIDIRVDDHPDPVAELARELPLHRAFDSIGGLIFAPRLMMGPYENVGEEELSTVLDALDDAMDVLGDNVEAAFWQAALLARAGRSSEARAAFDTVFSRAPHLQQFLRSVGQAGIVPDAERFL